MPTLVFVYAVDGGILPTVWDVLHKLVSPKNYPCNLCALTYGPVSERAAWSKLKAELPLRSRFLHRDEFRREYSREAEFPAVFIDRGDRVEPLISKVEIDRCEGLEALIELVRARVRGVMPAGHA